MRKFRRRYPLVAVAALMLATPLLVAATSGKSKTARASAVSCGQTVTTSVVLANDLFCPSSDGLDVGANGITINLNGHTITGPGTSFTGVFDSAHTGVTIANGTITAFGFGVLLQSGANGSHLQGLRLVNNSTGAFATGSNSVVINGNYAVSNTGDGIETNGGAVVSNNWLEANGAGIESIGNVVASQNRALDNSTAGIFVSTSSTGQVSGNTTNGNGTAGIDTSNAGSNFTLNGNRASFNGGLGINAAAGQKDGGGNVVQDNSNAKQCLNVVCAEVSS